METAKMMDGAEMHPPNLARIVDMDFYLPCIIYFIFFQTVGWLVRHYCWREQSGFRQYRLRNLTVCLTHSLISGGCALSFMLARPDVMFNDAMHWYSYVAAQLPMLSMSYFVSDAIDMARHELSRWTIELFIHHIASVFVFGCAVLSCKFLPYAYWALLMEVNSVCLHLRSIMQISGVATSRPRLFIFVRSMNIATFIVFRFLVQVWQIHWAYVERANMHTVYTTVGVIGGIFFFVINTFLFIRVLAGDGCLGDYGRRHAAINRDASAGQIVSIAQDSANANGLDQQKLFMNGQHKAAQHFDNNNIASATEHHIDANDQDDCLTRMKLQQQNGHHYANGIIDSNGVNHVKNE